MTISSLDDSSPQPCALTRRRGVFKMALAIGVIGKGRAAVIAPVSPPPTTRTRPLGQGAGWRQLLWERQGRKVCLQVAQDLVLLGSLVKFIRVVLAEQLSLVHLLLNLFFLRAHPFPEAHKLEMRRR